MKYISDHDRDLTGDELNAQWAVKRLTEIAHTKDKNLSLWELDLCVLIRH